MKNTIITKNYPNTIPLIISGQGDRGITEYIISKATSYTNMYESLHCQKLDSQNQFEDENFGGVISDRTHGLSLVNKIMKYLFVLLMIFLMGCSVVYVPLKDAKITIQNSGGDCKDKAIAYQMKLHDQGIESCVTCGVLSFYSKPLFHCWNEVLCPEDGRWKLIDLDSVEGQLDGWDTEQSPEYMPYIRYNGKVTLHDIRFEQGFSWKSDKTLSYLSQNCHFNWIPIYSELDHLLH